MGGDLGDLVVTVCNFFCSSGWIRHVFAQVTTAGREGGSCHCGLEFCLCIFLAGDAQHELGFVVLLSFSSDFLVLCFTLFSLSLSLSLFSFYPRAVNVELFWGGGGHVV